MKGVKKCYGLLFLLAIMLGLSLNVSSDVNALKYKVNTIDFGNPNFGSTSQSHYYFSMSYDSSLFSSDPFTVYENYYFTTSSYTISQVPYYACQYGGEYHNSFRRSGTGDIKTIRSEFTYRLPYISYSSDVCNYLNKPYTFDDNYNYHFLKASLPSYTFGTPNLWVNLPYFYNLSGVYINADLKLDNGFINKSKVNFADIFGHAPYNLTQLRIPFGVDFKRQIGDLYSGRGLSLEGSFMFDADDPLNTIFTYDQNGTYEFIIQGPGTGNSSHDVFQCTMSLLDNRSNEEEYPWELFYKCSGFLSHSYNSGEYFLVLQFTASSGNVLWSYPARTMIYEGSYLITDGDPSPSDYDYGQEPTGFGLESSPGYPSHYEDPGSDTSTDWFSSLTNMFNFSIYNPFAPIFTMFSQPEQCVDIPIIAGMINSTETTYCSWWPASIRNIMTPVFGLSSIMLLFGFIVRWLGASSGNMFEDSLDSGSSRSSGSAPSASDLHSRGTATRGGYYKSASRFHHKGGK